MKNTPTKKIVCVSDTHGSLPEIPECDILLIAGDFTDCHIQPHMHSQHAIWLNKHFVPWVNSVPAKHVVGIAGNHDTIFENDLYSDIDRFNLTGRMTLLENEHTMVEAFKIFGSPVTPHFGTGWAYNGPDDPMHADKYFKMLWNKIDDDTDIVITHGPPKGIGDLVNNGWSTNGPENTGEYHLLQRVKDVNPSLHVFGHIHEGYGTHLDVFGKTLFVNASHRDENYKAVNPPIVLDVPCKYTQKCMEEE